MPRSYTATLTASAVTLCVLGAAVQFSPQAMAQNSGHNVAGFSVFFPATYPGAQRSSSTVQPVPTTVAREYSSVIYQPGQSPENTAPQEVQDVDSRSFHIAGSPTFDLLPSPEPTSDTVTLPEVEVEVPEPVQDQDVLDDADVETPESLTFIVNKLRALPADYKPENLVALPSTLSTDQLEARSEAVEAATKMFEAASNDGVDLTVVSAYRSYEYQQQLYAGYVAQHGVAHSDKVSAQPGYSEHQTGLALDVDSTGGSHTLKQSFGETAAGKWLAEHAVDYGFVIRYPQDQQEVTGFQFEPWHLRYFGDEYAQLIVEHSGVAETAFGLDPAPDYAP